MFWREKKWLLLSDLHLGKAAHFRKAGLPLPDGHDETTLERLDDLVRLFAPVRVVIIGDLFHSVENGYWRKFHVWCQRQKVELHLVLGNHDLIGESRYEDAGITLHKVSLTEEPFVLMHEPPLPNIGTGQYVICGHVHPGYTLSGKGRQRIALPCFWVGREVAVLPAFGTSTGLFRIQPKKKDRVYLLTPRAVMLVPTSKSSVALS